MHRQGGNVSDWAAGSKPETMPEGPDPQVLLAQPATAARLRALRRAGLLDAAGFEQALALAGLTPDRAAWRGFLDRLLAFLGIALLLSGVISFFAYNWSELSRLPKFALLEAGFLVAVAAAWRYGVDRIAGQAALFAAAVLPGVLFAFFGQTYQTGADPYGLFLMWAILILPWTVLARFGALWVLWLVIANLAFIFWWGEMVAVNEFADFAREFGPLLWLGFVFTDIELGLSLTAANVAALALAEWQAVRPRGIDGRLLPRLLMLAVLGILTVPMIRFIYDHWERNPLLNWVPLLWLAVVVAALWFYQRRCRDLFMLAATLLNVIVITTALLVKQMKDPGTLLFVSLLVVLMTAAAAWWLREVSRRWERDA